MKKEVSKYSTWILVAILCGYRIVSIRKNKNKLITPLGEVLKRPNIHSKNIKMLLEKGLIIRNENQACLVPGTTL